MTAIDPTVVIERMARRLRSAGATHPVAAATALAARGHLCVPQPEFAEATGLAIDAIRQAEHGEVPFGELPPPIGAGAAAAGADLLSLADLDHEWRNEPPAAAARR